MSNLDGDIRKELEVSPRKAVDETTKTNASIAESVGLEVRVTRIYDGVGVNHGKSECEWCKERCGENMTLEEAYRIGAFQRHPGCGCIIEYTSKKGDKTVQTGKYTGWNFADEFEKRKNIGLNNDFFADELISRVDKFIDIGVDDLYEEAKNGGKYKDELAYANKLTKPQLEKDIRSHIKEAEEHEWKIKNPEDYSERYKNGNARMKAIVINDWKNHRRKNARLAVIETRLWLEKFK